MSSPGFSDYIVFVDESGDHGLGVVSPDYPVFVLLFALFRKDDYVDRVCRDVQKLKLKFWGHDEAVLHEHDIRKPKGHFMILMKREIREAFQAELSALIASLPVTVVAVIIDKPAFVSKYHQPVSPYHYALEAGLERMYRELQARKASQSETPVVLECRGRKEDAELELAFRRVCDGGNVLNCKFPFKQVMTPKTANCVGLQLADLMARPVGLRHFRPDQPNRAFEIIQAKLRRSAAGRVEGWGLKILP